MFRRNITPKLLQALADTPVVMLKGARQTGKSTLARQAISEGYAAQYLTLDDAAVLSAAASDTAGFLAGLSGPVVIDEVQRAPELFLAIKAEVDRDRRPGRFLLTGSADVQLLPRLSESLAGRMEVLTLWPLSQGEMAGSQERFIDAMFGGGKFG
ncbi:MAG TPA: AAA family ATPase, partial [Blastocatellia bacterium]|nr:AAA family ATPase [Blastocatellia bacterium]